MKQNRDGVIEIEISEINPKYHEFIEHLDSSGICIATNGGVKQFYAVHMEVFEEMEMQLSLYRKALEELEDIQDDQEITFDKQFQS